MPYSPTSSIITYSGQSLNYIWDSVTGFFYTAGGAQFTIVIVILFFTVLIVVGGVAYVLRGGRKHF